MIAFLTAEKAHSRAAEPDGEASRLALLHFLNPFVFAVK
jgi:hypothetical protein